MVGFSLSYGCSSDDDDGAANGGTAGVDGGGSGGDGGSGGSTGGSGGSVGASGGSGGSGGSTECAEFGNDATCTACLKQQCCAEANSCDGTDCKALVTCARACPDPNDTEGTCFQACLTGIQDTGSFNQLLICAQRKCKTQPTDGGTGTAGAAGASPDPDACNHL